MASRSSAKMTIQERLRKWAPTPGSICDEAAQVIDTITAERDRALRALRAIADFRFSWEHGPVSRIDALQYVQDIARTALSQHTEDVGELVRWLRQLRHAWHDYDWDELTQAADKLLSQQREIEMLRKEAEAYMNTIDVLRTALSQHTQSGE